MPLLPGDIRTQGCSLTFDGKHTIQQTMKYTIHRVDEKAVDQPSEDKASKFSLKLTSETLVPAEYLYPFDPTTFKKQPFPGLTKWLTALRNGEYKQGWYSLHDSDNNSFCCLGVLCSIRNTLINGYDGGQVSDDRFNNVRLAHKNQLVLDKVMSPLGSFGFPADAPTEFYAVRITQDDGTLKRDTSALTMCNDHELTFAQIADILDTFWYDSDLPQV